MKDRFCLNSVSSFKDINSSNTNRSKTKQTFSFNKSARFDNIRSNCSKNTYGGEQLRRKNSGAGIGYGTRSDFTKCLSVSPSSSKYNLRASFDENLQKRKGCSIGLGRDKVSFDSYVDKQVCKVPGATKYNSDRRPTSNRAPLFSMRKKTKIQDKSMTIESQTITPGPGTYENPEIDVHRTSFSSKFQRLSYSPARTMRFNTFNNKTPGPGKYNDISNLSSVGKYIVSSHQGGTIAKFDRNKRVTKFDQAAKHSMVNPGPGNYRIPSEFGQYDGDVYRFKTINVQSTVTSRMRK